MKTHILARCLPVLLLQAGVLLSRSDEKSAPPKPDSPAEEKSGAANESDKQAKTAVEAAFRKFWESLVKKDEKAVLSMMTDLKEMPENYMSSKLQQLLKRAESNPDLKIVEFRELTEVAAVLCDKTNPGKKADYGLMLSRKDGEQWKFADHALFDKRKPLPSVSDTSRKEYDELSAWCDKREAESRQPAK